jgi:hypothetical protein
MVMEVYLGAVLICGGRYWAPWWVIELMSWESIHCSQIGKCNISYVWVGDGLSLYVYV